MVLNLFKAVVDAGFKQISDNTLDSLRGYLNISSNKKNLKDFMGELTALPRMKSIPQINQLTKWEKFAMTKGINKKNKSRLVLDEPTGD